jgi:hypothetical protein
VGLQKHFPPEMVSSLVARGGQEGGYVWAFCLTLKQMLALPRALGGLDGWSEASPGAGGGGGLKREVHASPWQGDPHEEIGSHQVGVLPQCASHGRSSQRAYVLHTGLLVPVASQTRMQVIPIFSLGGDYGVSEIQAFK